MMDYEIYKATEGRKTYLVFTYRQLASSISHSTTPQKVECLGSNVKECVGLVSIRTI